MQDLKTALGIGAVLATPISPTFGLDALGADAGFVFPADGDHCSLVVPAPDGDVGLAASGSDPASDPLRWTIEEDETLRRKCARADRRDKARGECEIRVLVERRTLA